MIRNFSSLPPRPDKFRYEPCHLSRREHEAKLSPNSTAEDKGLNHSVTKVSFLKQSWSECHSLHTYAICSYHL